MLSPDDRVPHTPSDADRMASNSGIQPLHWRSDLPGPSRRWWLAVAVATLIALPLGWLLSYGAALPFYLGLFFYMLFGLIIGATVFRVAAPGRPYSTPTILIGTTWLVAVAWGVSIIKESHDFPKDVARRVALRTRDLGNRSLEQFRLEVADDVRQYLAGRYGPGSHWGYVRWVLTNGQIKAGELNTVPQAVPLPAGQVRSGWAFRVVASIGLLAFGVASQTLLLRRSEKPGPVARMEKRV